jgi:hypothetical protein
MRKLLCWLFGHRWYGHDAVVTEGVITSIVCERCDQKHILI